MRVTAQRLRVIASQNLKRCNIAAAVAAAQQARSDRTGITQDRVLLELQHLAFSNTDHYLVDDAGHVTLSKDAPAHAMSAVSTVKRKVSHRAFGANTVDETDVEIALRDKPSMLKLACRHVGLFPQRIELTGKGPHPLMPPVSSLSDAELRAMLLNAASSVCVNRSPALRELRAVRRSREGGPIRILETPRRCDAGLSPLRSTRPERTVGKDYGERNAREGCPTVRP